MVVKALTIIVPAYNMQDYLPQCVESLLDGSSEALEVLVVNDGSTDRTSEIAHDFARRHPSIVWVIDKSNGHYGSAVNAGLDAASGFYVKVIDADDSVEPSAFQCLIDVAVKQMGAGTAAADLLVNDWVVVNASGVLSQVFRHPRMRSDGSKSVDSLPDVAIRDLQTFALTYRRDLLKGISYRQTEGIPYTDTEWSILPMRMVKTLLYVPAVVVRYRMGRQGQTMAPETYARDFPIVESILSKIVLGYRDGLESGFFSQCLAVQLGGVYYMHLADPFWTRHPVPNGDLCGFDELLAKHPELYRRTGDMPLSRKVGFRYISEWRRGRTDRTLKFFLWRMYARSVMLVMKMVG